MNQALPFFVLVSSILFSVRKVLCVYMPFAYDRDRAHPILCDTITPNKIQIALSSLSSVEPIADSVSHNTTQSASVRTCMHELKLLTFEYI
jgi:hypothetical protein